MNTIKIFENQAFGAIRTLVRDAEPWFVGKDVAEALGYSNSRDALAKRVDDEDKGVAYCDTLGGSQEMTIINESGVYSLIFSSKLPEAKKFKHWVANDVLPSIRKHGMYASDEVLQSLVDDPERAIVLFKAMKAERDAEKEADVLNFLRGIEDEVEDLDYLKKIFSQKQSVKLSQIADDYGYDEEHFECVLGDLQLMYYHNHYWRLYDKYFLEGMIEKCKTTYVTKAGDVKTHETTLWTQKGRIFLYEKLKAYGYYPTKH